MTRNLESQPVAPRRKILTLEAISLPKPHPGPGVLARSGHQEKAAYARAFELAFPYLIPYFIPDESDCDQ